MTDSSSPTEILAEGAFKSIDGQRKTLQEQGITAEVIRPPGSDPNG